MALSTPERVARNRLSMSPNAPLSDDEDIVGAVCPEEHGASQSPSCVHTSSDGNLGSPWQWSKVGDGGYSAVLGVEELEEDDSIDFRYSLSLEEEEALAVPPFCNDWI